MIGNASRFPDKRLSKQAAHAQMVQFLYCCAPSVLAGVTIDDLLRRYRVDRETASHELVMACQRRSAFSILDDPAAPTWHEDPRDDDPRSEDQRQAAFLRQAHLLCPCVDIFAVPNAGKRTQWEANKRHREGMKAGALDLVASWNRGVAFLEFKDGRSMPDANQRDRLAMYMRQGHHAGVFRQERSALEWLRSLGAPFIDRSGL